MESVLALVEMHVPIAPGIKMHLGLWAWGAIQSSHEKSHEQGKRNENVFEASRGAAKYDRPDMGSHMGIS